MTASGESGHWIERIIGGLVVGAIAFGLLSLWNTWDLTPKVRLAASGAIGVLFLFAGKDIWNWISKIDRWS